MTEHARLTASLPGLIVRLAGDMTARDVAAVIDAGLPYPPEPPPVVEVVRVRPLPERADKGFRGRWPTLVEFARQERILSRAELALSIAALSTCSPASEIEQRAPGGDSAPLPGATSQEDAG